MIRELKESFLQWLSRQLVPSRPTLAEYDALAQPGIQEEIARYHRQNRETAIPDHLAGLACDRSRFVWSRKSTPDQKF